MSSRTDMGTCNKSVVCASTRLSQAQNASLRRGACPRGSHAAPPRWHAGLSDTCKRLEDLSITQKRAAYLVVLYVNDPVHHAFHIGMQPGIFLGLTGTAGQLKFEQGVSIAAGSISDCTRLPKTLLDVGTCIEPGPDALQRLAQCVALRDGQTA